MLLVKMSGDSFGVEARCVAHASEVEDGRLM
jgi:hypothetical protein